jgi:hypothetical protein
MFSLESFYNLLYLNLFKPINGNAFYYNKFGSTNPKDLALIAEVGTDRENHKQKFAIFHDQEPIYPNHLSQLWTADFADLPSEWIIMHLQYLIQNESGFWLLANSEHSPAKDQLLKTLGHYQDWYYFYHGFAALDWFRNCQYQPPIRNYTKVFICFNHLVTRKRSYRLTLIAQLIARDIIHDGYVSMLLDRSARLIKDEVFDPHSELSLASKKLITQTMLPNPPKLFIDTDEVHGALSATDDLATLCKGLFHVVTETIFYDAKLHLTEKIFKPIVARRPFILVGAPGNLAYLRSYGFKTFDQWIDESYDDIIDPDERIAAIVDQIETLCRLDADKLEAMYQEMQAVLEHNFNWFYNGFKQVIVTELVDNFESCLIAHNKTSNNYIDYSSIDFDEVKHRLSS